MIRKNVLFPKIDIVKLFINNRLYEHHNNKKSLVTIQMKNKSLMQTQNNKLLLVENLKKTLVLMKTYHYKNLKKT